MSLDRTIHILHVILGWSIAFVLYAVFLTHTILHATSKSEYLNKIHKTFSVTSLEKQKMFIHDFSIPSFHAVRVSRSIDGKSYLGFIHFWNSALFFKKIYKSLFFSISIVDMNPSTYNRIRLYMQMRI